MNTQPILGVVKKCKPHVELFAPFRATVNHISKVIKSATTTGHTLPVNNAGTMDMCISYYQQIKRICNPSCGCKPDHAAHNDANTAHLSDGMV
jgi:hypothetical protein